MRDIFVAELVGTFLLILLGDGVVSNVLTRRSGMYNGGPVQITLGWGLAVMIPATIFGAISGAHFNPALTIALAYKGDIAWNTVGYYILGQMLGAMLGALLLYLLFKDHYNDTCEVDPAIVRGCFCTAPSIKNTWRNFLSEMVGTFVLVFAILGFGNVEGAASVGVNYLYVNGIIISIGMSLGGLTGYAINPARDLGPRIMYQILPFKEKADVMWNYSWIPVVGPIVGGLLAVVLFNVVF
ncbi:Glyceroaquaporin [Anaerococcus octavius]|uniref:Glyceroaquaporin n=1 Tax=Anaerococcus octavius TaxID=54007 RepID=A0A380WS66_9FIRM|nr:MIP/aquaporin family protein [Anaerococcus octavius]SUU91841.1 Glyceroaquaporin [Anaerococcus octavius]